MEFSVSRNHLNQALTRVSRLANSRMPLPILNNILLTTEPGHLILSVTDLELGIQTKIPAEITKEGKFTVPARLLHEFIQSSSEDSLTGTVSDNATLTLKGNQSQVKMRGMDASEFPALPFMVGNATFQVKGTALKEAADMVAYATAIDDTRPVLAGVLLTSDQSELTVVATDSYRLAEKKIKLGQPVAQAFSVIVPKRTFSEIARLAGEEPGDISVFVGDNQLEVEIGLTRLVSRLVEGTYPPYQAIVPNGYQTRVTANNQEFSAALKTSQLFARESGNLITLTMVPGGGVTVRSAASQRGEATNQFTAITEGEQLEIGFNVKFLLDALSVIKADNVFLEFNGTEKPVVFRPANSKEYFSLVMPLRLD